MKELIRDSRIHAFRYFGDQIYVGTKALPHVLQTTVSHNAKILAGGGGAGSPFFISLALSHDR